MFRSLVFVAFLATLSVAPVSVRADLVQTFSGAAPLTPTNSSGVISLPKFDSSLGSLEAVLISLSGHVEGTARYESMNASPRTVTLKLAAQIDLKDDQNNLISSTLPLVSFTSAASAYDGVLDFGGTSGHTYANLSADNSAPLHNYTNPVDLAKFIGNDMLSFPLVATGTSTGTGPGNIVYQFSTATSASVEIQYTYAPAPEPAGLAMLLLAAVRLRRRR